MRKLKKKLKKKKPVRPIYKPVNWKTINDTWNESEDLGRRLRMDFALLYLTGARVSEIIKLRKQDFQYSQDSSGRQVLTVQLPTLKNRNEPYRVIPLVKEEPYLPMINEIETYIGHLDPHHRLFKSNHRRTMARQLERFPEFTTTGIIAKTKENHTFTRKWYPHYLRHCRLTHLVQYHKADALKLMFWAGWSDPRLARTYIHLDWSSLAELIQAGQVPLNY